MLIYRCWYLHVDIYMLISICWHPYREGRDSTICGVSQLLVGYTYAYLYCDIQKDIYIQYEMRWYVFDWYILYVVWLRYIRYRLIDIYEMLFDDEMYLGTWQEHTGFLHNRHFHEPAQRPPDMKKDLNIQHQGMWTWLQSDDHHSIQVGKYVSI